MNKTREKGGMVIEIIKCVCFSSTLSAPRARHLFSLFLFFLFISVFLWASRRLSRHRRPSSTNDRSTVFTPQRPPIFFFFRILFRDSFPGFFSRRESLPPLSVFVRDSLNVWMGIYGIYQDSRRGIFFFVFIEMSGNF